MRTAALVLLAILFTGCAGPQNTAGVDDGGAPIGATRITVQMDAPADDAFRNTARLLQREGYTIASSDGDLGTLRTETKPIRGSWEVRYSASVVNEKPTQIQLTGHASAAPIGESAIQKKGQTGSLMRRGWAEMHRLAERMGEAMPPSKLAYGQ